MKNHNINLFKKNSKLGKIVVATIHISIFETKQKKVLTYIFHKYSTFFPFFKNQFKILTYKRNVTNFVCFCNKISYHTQNLSGNKNNNILKVCLKM